MKAAASLIATLSILLLPPAIAADDHHAKHGGQVRETASFDLELVAKDKELTLYVSDHKGKGTALKDATAIATVLSGKNKETVKLTAAGQGALKGAGNFTITTDTKIVVSVTVAANTEQARFAPLQKEKADDHKSHKH